MSPLVAETENVTKAGRRLDIGAGAKRDPRFEAMDISPAYAPDFQHDLTELPWPFEDGAFVEVRCWHVLEHIERKHLIGVMNEMWRILEPGGIADIEVPVFPYWTAIADPTHVSFFVPQSFWYFTREQYAEHRDLYGIRPWKMTSAVRDEMGSVIRVGLEKP